MSGRGSSDIPTLRLKVLQDFVTSFTMDPNLVMMNLFPSRNAKSSSVKWESKRGGRGMTPFVPPGSRAPLSAGQGIAQHEAEAAYWKEKRYFDEEFLNNLRRPGTDADHMEAAQILSDNMSDIVNRSQRRKEWMFCQMMFAGALTYQLKGGVSFTLDYGIPTDHIVALTSSYMWGSGGSANIMKDVKTAKRKIAEANGGKMDYMIMNSQTLDYMGEDGTIRGYLQKNAFGDGSYLASSGVNWLALVNPTVLKQLLDIPNLVIYDEMYEVKGELTASVTGGSTTWLTVDDASDFTPDETLKIWDRSTADTYEEAYIISVDKFNNKIQIDSPFTNSYIAGEDFVTMQRYFVPSGKVCMFASKVENRPIARYYQAPFGLGRHYGLYTDKKDEWDPEGTYIRVQDKGLPVLLQPDAVYVLDVRQTSAEAATTTTTTSTTTTTTA